MSTNYYTTTTELIEFDPVLSRLTVEVNTVWAPTGAITDTQTIVVTLPFDSEGNVPTDPSVIQAIVDDRVRVRVGDVALKIPPGGVTNATDIFALTSNSETANTLNILLVPFPLAGETNSNFTRSVMCALDTVGAVASGLPLDRLNLPDPLTLGHGVSILDNGNVDGGSVINIRGNSNQGPYQNSEIVWDPTAVVPSAVLAQYPWMFHSALDTQVPGFNFNDYLSFFYIEHAPMSIIGTFAAGYFLYS